MLGMKEKKKSVPSGDKQAEPTVFPLRLPDSRLADALDEHARRSKRSRNMAIVVILEEAMRSAGLWPPNDQ
jgi:hypothetical protein